MIFNSYNFSIIKAAFSKSIFSTFLSLIMSQIPNSTKSSIKSAIVLISCNNASFSISLRYSIANGKLPLANLKIPKLYSFSITFANNCDLETTLIASHNTANVYSLIKLISKNC